MDIPIIPMSIHEFVNIQLCINNNQIMQCRYNTSPMGWLRSLFGFHVIKCTILAPSHRTFLPRNLDPGADDCVVVIVGVGAEQQCNVNVLGGMKSSWCFFLKGLY